MVYCCHHQETWPDQCHTAIAGEHVESGCKESAGDQQHRHATKDEKLSGVDGGLGGGVSFGVDRVLYGGRVVEVMWGSV